MIDALKDEVLTITEEAEGLGLPILWSDAIQDNLAILSNHNAGRVVALFAVKSSTASAYVFRSFSLNVAKWNWARTEGFTPQQMYDKLGDMIFEEIPNDSIINVLSR